MMGNKNLNLGSINDALGELGLVATTAPALFGLNNPEVTIGITDGKPESHGPVFERALNRFGGIKRICNAA